MLQEYSSRGTELPGELGPGAGVLFAEEFLAEPNLDVGFSGEGQLGAALRVVPDDQAFHFRCL